MTDAIETGYLLDSDTISLYVHHQERHEILKNRILSVANKRIRVPIVVVEEALAGAFALINNPKNPAGMTAGCQFLRKIMSDYSEFQIFPFDPNAQAIYKSMSAETKRLGKNDCKIAAIALANGLTVVTRNVKHFVQIPNATFEDWT